MKLDNKAIEQLRNDVGPEILPVVMSSFVTELGQRLGALQEAIQRSDLAALQAHAHSVKSTARTVGLHEVGDVAAKVDDLARDGNLEQALENARSLVALCDEGRQLVEAWIG